MAVIFIPGTSGNYQCLSTDLSGSSPVEKVSWIGANLFCTDTGEWFRVDENLYLVPFTHPISGSINIDNFPNAFSGSVTNFPDTYSGSITNFPNTYSGSITNFPTTFSGSITNFPDIQPVSGSINILNYPNTYSGSITNVISASFVEGGSSVFVENFVTDGSALWVDNVVSASFVAGGSGVWLEGSAGQQVSVGGSVITTLYTESGCPIDAHLEADGGYHLGVSITQSVIADPNNSSDINLDASGSYTFIGTATSTLGVVGLQWSLKTDQNATVYIEEGPNDTNWDLCYSFNYIASLGGAGGTVQATQSYWRIRVVLTNSIDTTYFRLQGVLCPIATPLPSSLSSEGRLKTESHISDADDRHVIVAPTGALNTFDWVRLVGTTFDGVTKDTNFWTESIVTSGSVTQSGNISLTTGSTALGAASYTTKRKARFVASCPNRFLGIFNFVTALTINNIRRMGAYTTTDGFFFQANGTTFQVGTRKASSDTVVSSGSFNGILGTTWAPTANISYKFEIEYTPKGVFWYVNGSLLHKNTSAGLVNSLALPASFETTNSGALTTAIVFISYVNTIVREGLFLTAPTSYYHASGQTAGVNLKIGAGNIHSIVFGSAANNAVVTLIDNTSGSAPVLWEYNATGALDVPIDVGFSGMPFYTGLRIIVKTGNASFTTIYE